MTIIQENWLKHGYAIERNDPNGGKYLTSKVPEYLSPAKRMLLSILFWNGMEAFIQNCENAGYKPKELLGLIALDTDGMVLTDED